MRNFERITILIIFAFWSQSYCEPTLKEFMDAWESGSAKELIKNFFPDILDRCTNFFEINFQSLAMWVNSEGFSACRDSQEFVDFVSPYVQTRKFLPETYIIVIGDTHGSISIKKILQKLQKYPNVQNPFLDKDFKIRDKSRVLFVLLGDYVDRGIYNMENLCAVALFCCENFENVIAMRGNHEVYSSMNLERQYPTLSDDIEETFFNDVDIEPYDKSMVAALNLFDYLPLISYIIINDSYVFQFCHAAFPLAFEKKSCAIEGSETISWWNDDQIDVYYPSNLLSLSSEYKFFEIIKNSDKADNCVWLDFGHYGQRYGAYNNTIVDTSDRGGNQVIGIEWAKNHLKKINQNLIENGSKLKVVAVIRGHQHTSPGLFLFSSNDSNDIVNPNNLGTGGLRPWREVVGYKPSFKLSDLSVPIITTSTCFNDDQYSFLVIKTGMAFEDCVAIPVEG